jgi:hypothetical protein
MEINDVNLLNRTANEADLGSRPSLKIMEREITKVVPSVKMVKILNFQSLPECSTRFYQLFAHRLRLPEVL